MFYKDRNKNRIAKFDIFRTLKSSRSVRVLARGLFQIGRELDGLGDNLLDVWNVVVLGNVDADADSDGERKWASEHIRRDALALKKHNAVWLAIMSRKVRVTECAWISYCRSFCNHDIASISIDSIIYPRRSNKKVRKPKAETTTCTRVSVKRHDWRKYAR